MREYVLIDKADKKQLFHLGQPDICIPGYQESNIKAIKKCRMGRTINYRPEGVQLSILLMRNGGLNLVDFSEKFKKKPMTKENKEKVADFWVESHRLFMGLFAFSKKNIIHHDLKGGNIVYFEDKNRVNYIDFGLMNKKTKLKTRCKKNKNWLANVHWSFPPEIEYLNKIMFDSTCTKSEETKKQMVNYIGKSFMKSKKQTTIAVRTLYSAVIKNPTTFKIPHPGMYLGGFLQTLKYIDNVDKYDEFLDKSLSTIDSYGLACGLMETLCNLYLFMDIDFVRELASIFYRMLEPNITKRLTIYEATQLYEECLRKHILKDRKKEFKKNKLVNETVATTVFDNEISTITQASIAITSKKELKKLMTSVSCPDGKEINPNTGRCVLNCKNGYVRDKKFKCTRKKITNSECPEGKVLNTKTNRCINKPITVKKRECPEGKVLNEKTNRCIKIKIKA
jgi:serine/threonine protein kinase